MAEFTESHIPYFEVLADEELSDEAAIAVVALRRIITQQNEALLEKDRLLKEAELRASTDALTGIGNRSAFDHDLERLAHDIMSMGDHRDAEPYAHFRWVLILGDLDYFKLVNDVLGYEFGDATLTTIAKLLQDSIRYDDKVYRLGGDEFAAIVPVLPGKENSAFEVITQRFQSRLENARAVDHISPELEALRAIGISFAFGVFTDTPSSVEDLAKTVAETMRRVKSIKEAKGTDLR